MLLSVLASPCGIPRIGRFLGLNPLTEQKQNTGRFFESKVLIKGFIFLVFSGTGCAG